MPDGLTYLPPTSPHTLRPGDGEATRDLIHARALIADERDWCTGALGLTEDGDSVPGDHPSAVRRCSIGALQAAEAQLGVGQGRPYTHLLQAADKLGYLTPVSLNNRGGHALTLRMFDIAIALSRGEAGHG